MARARRPKTSLVLERLDTWSSASVLALSLVGVVGVGVIDFATGLEIRVHPLYDLPLALAAWRFGARTGVALAAVCSVIWAVSNELAGAHFHGPLVWTVNLATQTLAFAIVALLIAAIRARLEAEREASRVDPLTGLPNRRAFEESASLLAEGLGRRRAPATLAFVDLDNFKAVNDTHGHAAGDQALQTVAEVFRAELRATDLAARIGGDEFVLFLADADDAQSGVLLERIRQRLAETFRARGWPVTASVGALTLLRCPASIAEVVKRADALMYAAKQQGKNRLHHAVEPAAGASEPLRAASSASP